MQPSTTRVKYVFLDIVSFTNDRSVEAQSEIISELNGLVLDALHAQAVNENHEILLPTGDGLAIAPVEDGSFDIHLKVALRIIRLLSERNATVKDTMRQFEVRIGLNENVDNIVVDINGRRNVAGLGISMAQRIMDQADGSQVLVGQAVYETLRQREKYMKWFRRYTATIKHGQQIPVFQFVLPSPGLNVEVPKAFDTPAKEFGIQ